MATVDLSIFDFAGMADSNGDSPAVGASVNEFRLFQRNTAPPALPTMTNALTNESMFHNTQSTTAGLFNSAVGTPGIGAQGVALGPGVSIRHNVFATHCAKNGIWWLETMMSIDGPLDTTQTRYLIRAEGQGGLLLKYVSGNWRFVVDQGGSNEHVFTNIDVPIQNAAIESVPKPFYLRLVREFPSSGNGEAHLVVNNGTTTTTQTLTGIVKPSTVTTAVNDAGFGDAGGQLNFWWIRQRGTDTATTVGNLQGTYWSTPTAFENVSYFTDAGSTPDCGINDQYWHELTLTSGSFGNALTMNGGGRLKVRVLGSNTAPTGSVSGDFSSEAYLTVQNNALPLSDPQGRYLKMEWRFEVGSDWPLGSGAAFVFSSTQNLVQLSHFATASGVNEVTLPIGNEGASGGTLPFTPEQPVETVLSPRTVLTRMEYPYTVARPLGTVIRRSYALTWLLTATEVATLESFFNSRDGGEEAFTWTAPGDTATSKAALTSELQIDKLAPDAFEVRANVTEVF